MNHARYFDILSNNNDKVISVLKENKSREESEKKVIEILTKNVDEKLKLKLTLTLKQQFNTIYNDFKLVTAGGTPSIEKAIKSLGIKHG